MKPVTRGLYYYFYSYRYIWESTCKEARHPFILRVCLTLINLSLFWLLIPLWIIDNIRDQKKVSA